VGQKSHQSSNYDINATVQDKMKQISPKLAQSYYTMATFNFILRNSRSILMKLISFYLGRMHQCGDLSDFLAHPKLASSYSLKLT